MRGLVEIFFPQRIAANICEHVFAGIRRCSHIRILCVTAAFCKTDQILRYSSMTFSDTTAEQPSIILVT